MSIKKCIRLCLAFYLAAFLFGCASLGTTKPNSPFSGNSSPAMLNDVAQKKPLLVQELGRLPELHDRISPEEEKALEDLVRLYNENPSSFNAAFEQMYKIGKPEVRKYCSPLQALFWLAEDNELSNHKDLISDYSLEKLLKKSWKSNLLSYRLISDSQIREIIDGTVDEGVKNVYLDDLRNGRTYDLMQRDFVADYKRSKRTRTKVFSKKSAKIIKENLINVKSPRWGDTNIIIERLNAPELLDFYINENITYAHYSRGYHRGASSIIKERYGDCDDLAYFGRKVLSKAGYDVFGRIVGDTKTSCHIGLGVKLDDGSYLLAVEFDHSGNQMSGPYETLLEVDKAIGYGKRFSERGPFQFNWK